MPLYTLVLNLSFFTNKLLKPRFTRYTLARKAEIFCELGHNSLAVIYISGFPVNYSWIEINYLKTFLDIKVCIMEK